MQFPLVTKLLVSQSTCLGMTYGISILKRYLYHSIDL